MKKDIAEKVYFSQIFLKRDIKLSLSALFHKKIVKEVERWDQKQVAVHKCFVKMFQVRTAKLHCKHFLKSWFHFNAVGYGS